MKRAPWMMREKGFDLGGKTVGQKNPAALVNVVVALLAVFPGPWSPLWSPASVGAAAGSASEETAFTVSPLDPREIVQIVPLGNIDPRGGHVLPTDHIYFDYGAKTNLRVFAPAGGTVYALREQIHGGVKIEVRVDEHISYYVAHLVSEARIRVGVQVKAGEILGIVSGESMLDLGACDGRVKLAGFANPARYPEPTLHTISPLALFAEPLRSKLRARVHRDGLDKDGKIDFDQPGRLVGNWFHESLVAGESGRGGPETSAKQIAFVYDVAHPKAVRISIGGTVAPTGLYAVQPGAPDPAAVSVERGPVKYQLTPLSSNGIGGAPHNPSNMLLVELISENRLRVECLLGNKTEEVRGFTSSACIFER
jgi:hypothetical protein